MTMHISRVRVENFKRLRGVDISTDGNVITIGGNNAQGKSSLIDAIWNAIGGKQKAVTQPIRAGERQASAEVTITDADGAGLVVKRTWKGETSKLTVTPLGAKGAIGSPQSTLDALVGAFAFDPMAFANSAPKVQRDTLADLVGLDLSELDRRRKEVYDGRTDIGRDKKRFAAALEEMGEPPVVGDAPDLQALLAERDELERVKREVNARTDRHAAINAEILDFEDRIRQLRAEQDRIYEEASRGAEWIDARRPIEAIEADIARATEQGDARRAAEKYAALKDDLAEAETGWDDATAELARIDAEKAAKLAEANVPVEGLSFDDEQVLLNGIPFGQASAAERIRTSVAIAVAQNPKLRVICVKDATLMDESNLALLRSLAEEHNFQLFLELVGSTGNETVVIEDGGVA